LRRTRGFVFVKVGEAGESKERDEWLEVCYEQGQLEVLAACLYGVLELIQDLVEQQVPGNGGDRALGAARKTCWRSGKIVARSRVAE
jgi:hypothetical protein